MRITAFALLLACVCACQNGRTEPLADQGAAGGGEKYFQVSGTPSDFQVDARGNLVVSIVPAPKWKWNDEYPAKFSVADQDGVAVEKKEFSTKGKDIQISGGSAQWSIPLVVKKTGALDLQIKGSFSVCNDTSCKIYRDEMLSLAITGK
jgi:hypothetical protein